MHHHLTFTVWDVTAKLAQISFSFTNFQIKDSCKTWISASSMYDYFSFLSKPKPESLHFTAPLCVCGLGKYYIYIYLFILTYFCLILCLRDSSLFACVIFHSCAVFYCMNTYLNSLLDLCFQVGVGIWTHMCEHFNWACRRSGASGEGALIISLSGDFQIVTKLTS